MAELADALDSGSNERKLMEVQVLLSAPDLRSAIRKELLAAFLFLLDHKRDPFRYLFTCSNSYVSRV